MPETAFNFSPLALANNPRPPRTVAAREPPSSPLGGSHLVEIQQGCARRAEAPIDRAAASPRYLLHNRIVCFDRPASPRCPSRSISLLSPPALRWRFSRV